MRWGKTGVGCEEVTIGACRLICGDAREVLPTMPAMSIDLCVTSPPYDNLRQYGGHKWDFEPIATGVSACLQQGGVLVWIVSDATIAGSETGTSLRQALYWKEHCGLHLHDTMIYHRANPGGARGSIHGYWQEFDFMFVFTRGALRTFHPLQDRRNAQYARVFTLSGGRRNWDGTTQDSKTMNAAMYGRRGNIWTYRREAGGDHPAVFPEALARDHILSWTNVGDRVLDCFMGSGTSGVACAKLGRAFVGIDIEHKYFDLACRRIEQAYAQPDLMPPETWQEPTQLALAGERG
jgi:DNA modification methylase